MSTAYSSTPLAKKLGLKAGFRFFLHNPPNYYFELFSDLPEELHQAEEILPESLDFIHIFCTKQSELEKIIPEYKPALKKTGLLWMSWPKGSSSIPTDLKRDPIRELWLSAGLVDTKVAAIDADWSGLKFVYRLEDRG